MKIYKYKGLSQPTETEYVRLERIIQHRAVWCASPESLNDLQEFAWRCDFTLSPDTAELLTELLVRLKGRPREDARRRVLNAIDAGGIRAMAEPVIANLIRRCRDEIGVACFGTSPNNDTLWRRYAGDGAGVCVELDAPDRLLDDQLHRVIYSDKRVIHIDQLLRGGSDPRDGAVFYAALLSKTNSWEPESEIRFLCKKQRVAVVIEGAITRVILGPALDPSARARIRQIAGCIPVVERDAAAVLAWSGPDNDTHKGGA